jgi:hypothetical protein
MLLKFKEYLPYILGLIIFSCIIFYPELQGKKLGSHDSVSWYGAGKELLIYKEKGEDIKWTNRVFSGMPLYTIGGYFNGNFAMYAYYKLAEWFSPNIVLLLFLSCSVFFSLILLKIDKRIALFSAFLLAVNTWIIDSLVASHGTKILAVAFLFPIISGLIAFYKKNNSYGLAGIGIGLLFQIGINHLQITYYGALACGIFGIFLFIDAFQHKQILSFLKKSILIIILVGLAVLANYSNLWILKDYSKDTMRGGKTELIKPEANSTGKEGGLDINYAFSWSYTPTELFNFIVPDAKGGASGYKVNPSKSKLAQAIGQDKVPMYWGEQPFTGAPNYIGVVLVFLAIFSFFYWKNSLRWPFLFLIILFSAMGLGRFFLEFNQILFENLPFYNKFRTPTMAFSIVSMCVIFMGGIGLNHLIKTNEDSQEAMKALKHALYSITGLMIIGFLTIQSEGFTSTTDVQVFGQNPQALQLILEDRSSFFKADFIRSLFLIAITAGLIWSFITKKLSQSNFIIILGILMVGELFLVSNRFYDRDAFVKAEKIEDLVSNEPYNQYMMGDTTHFRMVNTSTNVFNDNTDGYRYSNVGGYSPAKLYRYQDLIDVHLSKMNMNVLNMLNTKYFVVDQNGQKVVQQNPDAAGNVWFPKSIQFAKNANEEMDSIGTSNPKEKVWVDQRYQSESKFDANNDPNATIYLSKYHPEKMEYQSQSTSGGFATFSEIWYRGNEDWKIYIDGKESKMIRTNYLLRGAYIPAGNHKIEMRYEQPKLDLLIKVGQGATLLLLLFVFVLPIIQKRRTKNNNAS